MRLYYVTTRQDAEEAVANGFTDRSGPRRPNVVRNEGVWLMSYPYIFDIEEYVCVAVDVDLPNKDIEEWHWHNQGTVWEWYLAPAAELNQHARAVILSQEEAAIVLMKYHYDTELPPMSFNA